MRVAITDQPIDPIEFLKSVESDAHGAVLLFVGTVRELNEGRRVTGIQYEAYRTMAERVLAQIVQEAEQKAGPCAIAVTHRIGELNVGEASVVIAISTPHRAQAFAGSRYIIEEIKKRLPVWKREAYEDGESGWVTGSEVSEGSAVPDPVPQESRE